jgi:hypothetical protein
LAPFTSGSGCQRISEPDLSPLLYKSITKNGNQTRQSYELSVSQRRIIPFYSGDILELKKIPFPIISENGIFKIKRIKLFCKE